MFRSGQRHQAGHLGNTGKKRGYLGDKFMALSYHLHVVSEKLNDVPPEMKYGTAAVLIGLILVINSISISLRVYLRSRKKW